MICLEADFACVVVQPLLVLNDAAAAEEINQLAQDDSTGSLQSNARHMLVLNMYKILEVSCNCRTVYKLVLSHIIRACLAVTSERGDL